MIDIDVAGGTPGWRLHGNLDVLGPRDVGVHDLAGRGDGRRRLQHARRVRTADALQDDRVCRRFSRAIENREYQRWYGRALTHIATAEAALHRAADLHMELCRRNVEDGIEYSYGDDMLVAGVAREVMLMCWNVVDDDLFQTGWRRAWRATASGPRGFCAIWR